MITLLDVSHHYGKGLNAKIILERANFRINDRDKLGILAATGSGKTSIARMLAGLTRPRSGLISRRSSLSWPLGFSAAFHPHLSAAENVRLVAALYNLDPIDLEVRVKVFSELNAEYYLPVEGLAPGLKGQLAMALSLSVDFDMYLADELSAVGSQLFQSKCEAALRERTNDSGLILLTRHVRTIERYCNRFAVLAGARLIVCEDAAQAVEILNFDQQKDDTHHALF